MRSESLLWTALRGAVVLCLTWSGWLGAANATAAPPVERLRAFLASASTLQAEFSQVQIAADGNPTGKKSSGVFYLERPGKFRWNYMQPIRQEIVAMSGKVSFYDADLEQVTVKRLNAAIGSTPALLLSGDVPLETNFRIEDQGTDEGMAWIRLIPKDEDSGFKYVLIGLVDGTLGGMELNDNFGQVTRIYFSKVRTGLKIAPGLFQFKPPPGVDVFEEK